MARAPTARRKFGLRGVSEVLRFDLRRHGIGVSLVCPGAVRTPLVGTVEIVGVDREQPDDPQADRALRAPRRQRPSTSRRRSSTAIERNRYLVFTSPDIRWASGCQRKFAKPYELTMRLLQRRFGKVVRATR